MPHPFWRSALNTQDLLLFPSLFFFSIFWGSKCSHIHPSSHWKRNPVFVRTSLNTEMRSSNTTVIADYNFYNRKEITEDKTVKLLKELTFSKLFLPKRTKRSKWKPEEFYRPPTPPPPHTQNLYSVLKWTRNILKMLLFMGKWEQSGLKQDVMMPHRFITKSMVYLMFQGLAKG